MRTIRFWFALACALALVVSVTVQPAFAQVAPGGAFDTDTFVDASGGDGGSARGGEGGRGGSGTVTVCSQNTNDTESAEDEPALNCGAGGRGGDGGDAGESVGGNGGIAFAIGGARPGTTPGSTPQDISQLLADLFVLQRAGSFIITVGNNGPDPAQGVQFSTTITVVSSAGIFGGISAPEGISCSSGVEPGTVITPETPPFSVTCSFGDLALAPGQTVEITIQWSPEECLTAELMSAAQVTAASPPDPNLSNNTSVLNVTETDPSPSCDEE